MGRLISHREVGERYAGLRILGGVFTVLGALLLIGSGLLFAVGLSSMVSGGAGLPPRETAPFSAPPVNPVHFPFTLRDSLLFLWSLGLLIPGLQFLAIGALFRLVIHVEENTRVTAQCLERLHSRIDRAEQRGESMFRS